MGNVKVWDSFSILLVLAMLLFLLPAAVLLGPRATVVLAAENTTLEQTANFVLSTVNTSGTWKTFTVGSSGAGSPYEMEQFTRQVVQSGSTVPGSGWRNYSNYTGTISGDISGSMWMKFNMWNFNTSYPYTPKYNASATYFGTMFGRGRVDGSGSDDFYFFFVADLDGNRNFTNATGKGLLASYDETGIYSGRKIIGSFTINIVNASYYSGTFNLRNYPPEEIRLQGITNATGEVNTVDTDRVAEQCKMVFFNRSKGDFHTDQSDVNKAGLDRIRRGQFPQQTVDSGPNGPNGKIDNSRNGFSDSGPSCYFLGFATCGRMEGVFPVNVYYNDTIAATGNDNSPYGWIYQILVLDGPYQTGGLNAWISQSGYLMMNFEMPNKATECYVGGESFGFNYMAFQLKINPPYPSYSHSTAYELRPTPKVLSCFPANGTAGTTMNVTLGGRYFLRHSSLCPLSNMSKIDFGPGITVNGWTVGNDSPIDNNITVNITIDPDATAGCRDVNVTAWFGNYSDASTWMNKTGTLDCGFTVNVSVTTANITGKVYEANASVLPGATVTLSGPRTNSTTSNATGWYLFTVNTTGSYTVNATKSGLTYFSKWANVTSLGSPVYCNFTGVDAPYPIAPDRFYCMKCSNLWLFGAWYDPEFALDAKKVSDVLTAWAART